MTSVSAVYLPSGGSSALVRPRKKTREWCKVSMIDASSVEEGIVEQKRCLVLELLCNEPGLYVFKMAAVNSHCAKRARQLFGEFLNRLVALSNHMGKASVKRADAFWKNRPVDANWLSIYFLSYEDRMGWHPHQRGIGNTSTDWWHSIPTRDQVFATCRTRECFAHAAALRQRPAHWKAGYWRASHALCEPFFVKGPINFYNRMAVPNRVLYNAVVYGVTPAKLTSMDKHQWFFLKRLLEARAATESCTCGSVCRGVCSVCVRPNASIKAVI